MCEQCCLSANSQSGKWIVLDGDGNKAKRAEEQIEGKSNFIFESIPATYFFSLKARAGNTYKINKTY